MYRTKKVPPTVWDDAQEVPRAGVPDAVRLERRFKFARRWWMVMPVAVSFAVSVIVSSQQASDAVVSQQEVSTPGRAVAEQTVRDWLSTDPSPLPGATVLAWEGAQTQTVDLEDQASSAGQTTSYTLERHTITVADESGRTYSVGVQVAVDDELGAKVTADPALIPIAPVAQDSDWPDLNGWPGLEVTGANESVVNAVNAWAKAFTSGDPIALQQQVSDPTAGRSYVPLSGVESVTAAVRFVATTDGADPALAKEVVARVDLSVVRPAPPSAPDESGEGEGGAEAEAPQTPDPVVMSYDILLTAANTATPKVVAWGTPGSGPGLSAYENAVPRLVSVDDTPLSVPTPQPAPDDEGSADDASEGDE